MRLVISARRSRHIPLAIGLAVITTVPTLAVVGSTSASRGTESGSPAVRLRLRPTVDRPGQGEQVEVSGLHVDSLQVDPAGAVEPSGQAFGWRSLRKVRGSWVASLPAPLLRGVYPLWLRTRSGARPFRSATWFLRVLAPRTLSRPSFESPAEAVRWWVRTVAHGTLDALRPWPFPAGDRRDRRLHSLFVVAYSPPGQPDPADRLGTFVTAFRDGYGGRWRFLEARLVPD